MKGIKASMSFDQIVMHCKFAHGKDINGKKAKRNMLMHLDGSDYFSSTYEFEVEGLTLTNVTVNARRKAWTNDD